MRATAPSPCSIAAQPHWRPRATDLQRDLAADTLLAALPVRVRVALHTGEAEPSDGDYFGPSVNLCARVRGAAHGGQTVLTQATYDLVSDHLPPGARLQDLGLFAFRNFERPERIYQVVQEGLAAGFPPLAATRVSRTACPPS